MATCFISDDIQNVISVSNQENVTSVPNQENVTSVSNQENVTSISKQEYITRAEIFGLNDYRSAFTLYNIGPVNRSFDEPLKVKITLDAAAYWANDYFVFCLCFPSIEGDFQDIDSIYCKSESGGRHFSRICLDHNQNNLYTKAISGPGNAHSFQIQQLSGNVDIFVAFETPYADQYITNVAITSNAFSPDTVNLTYNHYKKIKWSTEGGVADYCQLGAYASDKILNVSFVRFIAKFSIIILCVLRYIQGVWFCGLLCFNRKEETEDGNYNKNKSNDSKEANKPDGPMEIQVIERKKVEENLPGSDEKPKMPPSEDKQQQSFQQPGSAPPPNLPPPPPPPSKDSPKKKPAVTKDTTKDTKDTTEEKDSDGETDGATTNQTTNAAPAEKKKERVPNMLLLPTKEDDTQSEAQIPSKRKTKIEKNNKEPAPTKFTQDPTTGGVATGKPAAATTMKTGVKKTEAKTGIPKSETDLADKDGTKDDKENFETRPTQKQTATMATGAAKTTKTLGPTQVATQTTQGGGGGTTVGEKTGIAKTTRVTGKTQKFSTGTTQGRTGTTQKFSAGTTQAGTRKTQKFSTGTTQGRTGTTQKFSAGTTQAGTRTTQQGTTMATAYTQRASLATSSTPLYVCLGILGAILILIIIICVLRYIQGVWFCGLLCFKRKEETEDGNFDKNENKLNDSKEANKPDGPIEVQVIEGKKVEENLPGSDEKPKMPPSEDKQQQSSQQPGNAPPPPPPNLPPPPPPPSKDSPKKKKPAVTKDTTKDTKDTKDTTEEKDSDGETDGATTNQTTNAAPTPVEKKKERVPNMLLLPTKEDDTQSEGQIPSKRKTKVEKYNKEPAATKFTQDPTTGGIATGKPAAVTTMKTGIKRTEAQTGIPKSETDLATEKGGTKGDKEKFETRPTQKQTATMATGAAKTTKTQNYLPTQVGTQTTQGGGGTTVGEKTGIAKTTRVTGPTQIPKSDTNETQIQTGATKTKTKPTQFPTQTTTQVATGKTQKFSTGTTQGRTGTTQKFSAATTQAGTGTTQQGTTIATAYTQRASTGTTQGATRQTGETQNPDEADINIDPTQYAGTTVAGGGTSEPDPTQNPTATTVGKTSKTQLTGTAGTKTHTRTTQKQTKQTDDL
uniref:Uncharacterized protein n=1 Tax=Panagrolaimus sp. PS1159 TaxID=55785 RepID=A0AC35FS88_9BILA